MKINIVWLRRDLRLLDNTALNGALKADKPVLPVFIFDTLILEELRTDDPRVQFIHDTITSIHLQLVAHQKGVLVRIGSPLDVWKSIFDEYEIDTVYFNRDYEPYALDRDAQIVYFLRENGINTSSHKDQVIFEKDEVLKPDGTPYTVFTPYKKKWLQLFGDHVEPNTPINSTIRFEKFLTTKTHLPTLEEIGFVGSTIKVIPFDLYSLQYYDQTRDYPSQNNTSHLSPHLRFGTVSIRQIANIARKENDTFLSELIWREFFMQILYHFPEVVTNNFKSKYDGIAWRNDQHEFNKWKNGKTGYPIVDAGMRELNATGYMHNRVRMITASFLVKHLLIDWRWGEAYFAEKLLDYDLSANNGNWQWVAGTGCDAAPYFRIFNPTEQTKKFDPQMRYIKKWIPEINELNYPTPIVDHQYARQRALEAYKAGLNQ